MTHGCNHDHHNKQATQTSKLNFKAMTPADPAHSFVKNKVAAVPQETGCSDDHDHDDSCGSCCCAPASLNLAGLTASETVAEGIRTQIRIMQMDCPVEENLIRKKLGNMAAVKSLEFNLMQRVLTVVHEPESLESVLEAIRYRKALCTEKGDL
jgi:Cd2+/Zn2+-exporting ATPase